MSIWPALSCRAMTSSTMMMIHLTMKNLLPTDMVLRLRESSLAIGMALVLAESRLTRESCPSKSQTKKTKPTGDSSVKACSMRQNRATLRSFFWRMSDRRQLSLNSILSTKLSMPANCSSPLRATTDFRVQSTLLPNFQHSEVLPLLWVRIMAPAVGRPLVMALRVLKEIT